MRLRWIIFGLIAIYIIRDPSAAAVTATHLGNRLASAGSAVGAFVSKLGL
jgi:hypothetical protein